MTVVLVFEECVLRLIHRYSPLSRSLDDIQCFFMMSCKMDEICIVLFI